MTRNVVGRSLSFQNILSICISFTKYNLKCTGFKKMWNVLNAPTLRKIEGMASSKKPSEIRDDG